MSDDLSHDLGERVGDEAHRQLNAPQRSAEAPLPPSSHAWDDLRRRALLGEGLTSAGASGSTPFYDELALSAALRHTLPPPLAGATLDGREAPEQEGPYPDELEVLMSWLNARGDSGWGKSSKASELRVTVALSAYLCALAHKRHQLPIRLIAPVMSRLLKGRTTASLKRELLLPLSAFLQAIGPRGCWLLERLPGGEGLLQHSSKDSQPLDPQEHPSRLADVERLCGELTLALERSHEGSPPKKRPPKEASLKEDDVVVDVSMNTLTPLYPSAAQRNAQRKTTIKGAQRQLTQSLINLRPPELEDALASQPLQALLSAYPSLQTEALLELKRLLSSGQLISLWREA